MELGSAGETYIEPGSGDWNDLIAEAADLLEHSKAPLAAWPEVRAALLRSNAEDGFTGLTDDDLRQVLEELHDVAERRDRELPRRMK